MVNKANMRLWVEDLETTEAGQCTGALREDDKLLGPSFCCLGRAIEVYIANGGGDVEWDADRKRYASNSDDDVVATTALLSVVAGWLGLPDDLRKYDPPIASNGEPGFGRDHIIASEANDDLQWDFKRIGKAIREYYKLDED